MKKIMGKIIRWVPFLLAIAMLIAHSLSLEKVKIDNTSIILVLIILISPYIPAIKKLKFGEFEAEIDPKEVQEITDKAQDAIQSRDTSQEGARTPERLKAIDDMKALVEFDPVMALVKLRIEFEKVLKRLYKSTHKHVKNGRPWSVVRLVAVLEKEEILPKYFAHSIREFTSIGNRAAHGEDIRQIDAELIVTTGGDLLEELYWYLMDIVLRPEETVSIEQTEVDIFQKAKYRLTTVIPRTDNPVSSVRVLDQEELDDFLEGYNEYAEFIVDITKIDETGTQDEP